MASRGGRLLRAAVALAVLGGLAACSAGVPPTGEVVTVSPVAPSVPALDPESFEDAGGPESGQSESEVAIGFMNAMNTGNVAAVQPWLTPQASARVEHWNKRPPPIRVYSTFEPEEPLVRNGRRVVPIRIKVVGQLEGGREWYPATGDDLLSLELQSDGGDLRVANPGSVIWMRDVSFTRRYSWVELFLVPDVGDPSPTLAPVPVFVPRGGDGDPAAAAGRVDRTLRLLLQGAQGRYGNLHTAIPRGTRLRRFSFDGDVATVDLSREFTHAIGSGKLRVGQIVWTVTRQLPTAEVRILVDGRPVRDLGYDRFPAAGPWRRGDSGLSDLWPRRSRVGDSVLFVRGGEIYTAVPGANPLIKIFPLDPPGPKSSPTWSPDHRWMAFLVGSGDEQVMWLLQPGGKAIPATRTEQPGTLSPPTWSPDSKRVYVVRRAQGQTQLLEVTRSDASIRQLRLPPLPSGLEPASLAVSPDGAFVLAVGEPRERVAEGASPPPGGQLFVGQFGPEGVLRWSKRPIAPGLGRISSPVWVDPLNVAFIAETNNKDDLGKLWTVKSDGWDPRVVLNNDAEGVASVDIGNHLTIDPGSEFFVVTVRSSNGAALWTVDRDDPDTVRYLTSPAPNSFDTEPSFASR